MKKHKQRSRITFPRNSFSSFSAYALALFGFVVFFSSHATSAQADEDTSLSTVIASPHPISAPEKAFTFLENNKDENFSRKSKHHLAPSHPSKHLSFLRRTKNILYDMLPRFRKSLYRFSWQIRGTAGFSTISSQVGDPPNPNGYNTAIAHLKGQYGIGASFSFYPTEHFALQGTGDLTDQYGVVTNLYMVPDANGGFTTYNPGDRAMHAVLATLTLNAQYHALPNHLIDPYIGVGGLIAVSLDYRHVEQEHTATLATRPGFDIQVGMNVKLRPDVFASLEMRKLWSSTWLNVRDDRNTYAKNTVERHVVKMNPWLFSVGLGWKF